ncbi:GAF and ANTAR domain-containing protein [Streptomyces minutiscleroticus]|uniref:ANTAR domain-containing protein n=1 Tax=Streptomyces minutiscleroticus TaxID=68238 RepID=A0A918NUS1_9ACTN|nr:GAF and ANTAR domain-containing protein [Streptomyces minutiscleroticus]GGX96910.1 hypothetical protein GCM10010358_58310 [Streptomyces minutiscleroticus]
MSRDELTRFLTRLRRAADDGRDLSAASAATAARLLSVQGLTLSLRATSGALEPLWGTSTDEHAPGLEELQYTLGEGPTVDAARTGHTVIAADLTDRAAAERWPVLTAAPTSSPHAVIAVPLRLGVVTAGVLTGYRTTPGPFTPTQRLDLDAFARIALNLLLNTPPRTLAVPRPGTAPRPDVSLRRAQVHRAAGFLSSRLDITVEDALLRLRAHAFSHDRPLADVARDVLADRLHLTPDV